MSFGDLGRAESVGASSGMGCHILRLQTAVAGVTIFDGPPSEEASLAPYSEKTVGHDVTQTWQLPKSDRGYWLQCNYANTTAQISRRLPASATQCVVVYDHNERFSGGAYVVKSVNCK